MRTFLFVIPEDRAIMFERVTRGSHEDHTRRHKFAYEQINVTDIKYVAVKNKRSNN